MFIRINQKNQLYFKSQSRANIFTSFIPRSHYVSKACPFFISSGKKSAMLPTAAKYNTVSRQGPNRKYRFLYQPDYGEDIFDKTPSRKRQCVPQKSTHVLQIHLLCRAHEDRNRNGVSIPVSLYNIASRPEKTFRIFQKARDKSG